MAKKMEARGGNANFKFEIIRRLSDDAGMNEIIYPRSPREAMDGWSYLPRYIDKIRLHLAGELHADYQENLGKAFDGFWLKAAGLTHEQFVEVVKRTITDGEVADWVLKNVSRTDADRRTRAEGMLNYPKPD